jgi:molybdenum cofactor cytidylyltransferase
MRFFAVIPAAGASLRMGQDKLLMPWGDGTMIEAMLAAWRKSRVNHAIVTARAEQHALAELCVRAGAELALAATPPLDMKASVLIALEHIAKRFAPEPNDAWLLAPADMPLLSTAVIDALIDAHAAAVKANNSPLILTPLVRERRVHPVLFPWFIAKEVADLGENQGINSLVSGGRTATIDVSRLNADPSFFADIDTPAEYQQLSGIRRIPRM